ncbi:MAG: endonuclease Q family protein [Candidatus Wolfebacteria bacterium]|nr:endonuclease Q family protein [Candidatus Wolfebacteria bacterium]
MRFIADFHIHSKYSRATSKDMILEELDRWADDKGILVMGTGDFTHPVWINEIKTKLESAEHGLYKLKKELKLPTIKGTFSDTRFILTAEISGIYSRGGKTRRIHNILFSPSIEVVENINSALSAIGNLKSDGRPILGLDSEKLAEIVFGIDENVVIIPAHAWTPWFSIFGSMSGFDSIEECFGKYADKIFAIETGLSSDPAMNWRLSKLDKIALISNSDSHSLQKIGREANVLDTELSYEGIIKAIKNGAPEKLKNLKTEELKNKFVATLEFFPEEGKYHYDGHRVCGIVFSPEETKKHNGICPVCKRPLTVGVVYRVDQLADARPEITSKGNYHYFDNRVPYYNLVSLDEIISEAFGVGTASKKVKEAYMDLIKKFGSELKILLEISEEELRKSVDPIIVEGIKRVREGKVEIRPGYDGEYGEVKIFKDGEREKMKTQQALF